MIMLLYFFNIYRLINHKIVNLMLCSVFLHHPDVRPDSDGDADHQEVQQAEAEGDAGQGGGPGLQPPGHCLWAAVAESVAWGVGEVNIVMNV